MLRFLPGIILLQIATFVLAFALFDSEYSGNTVFALGFVSLIFACFIALWFSLIAREARHANINRVRRDHAREREKLLRDAEQQRARIMVESRREIERKTARAHARANFLAGSAFAAIIAAGGLLILSQFVTAGLLILAAGGGAVLGYTARSRHEQRQRRRMRHQQQRKAPGLPEAGDEQEKLSSRRKGLIPGITGTRAD
jgi:membrane protein implicated in regulation of membrane protease activity